MNFAGFTPAFEGASGVTDVLQRQEDTQRQLQAQAMLAKVLQAYAGQQQQGQGASMQAPPVPGGAIQPGGVSPLGGGAQPPAGNVSGGAGPAGAPMGGALPPIAPSGNAMSAPPSMPPGAPPGMMPGASPGGGQPFGGLDMSRLAMAAQQSGGSPGAQGALLQMITKMLQPQMANATRLEIAGANNATREDTTDKNIASRERVASANRMLKTRSPMLKDDPVYRALEDQLKAAQAANGAASSSDHDQTYSALVKASDALMNYAQTKKGAGGDSPLADLKKPAPIPVPAEAASQPDGAVATDEKGQKWVKQGNMMVPQ